MIVCSGNQDSIIKVKSFNNKSSCRIIDQKWNNLRFILIKEKTIGVVPYYFYGFPNCKEKFFSFNSDGKTITGNHFTVSAIPEVDWFFNYSLNSNGLILIQLDDKHEMNKLVSCAVFNDNLEFIGMSIMRFQTDSKQKGNKQAAIAII